MKCKIVDCDNTATMRDMCEKHYTRWRRHGDAMKVKEYPRRNITRYKNGECYIMIRLDNKYKGEHILFAEKALGKPLPKGAVVHHMDRDGTNNNTKSPWNLVICPNQGYHMLLHARARALGYEPMRKCDKITAKQVIEIKELSHIKASTLAKRYGVTIHTIKSIRFGTRG
jgi:HNH endonuclease